MTRPKKPPIPAERHDTIRREIVSFLERGAFTAKDVSQEVRIREKEVYGHLEHIERSLAREDRRLMVEPARCNGCGYVFRKRERLTKPGRCPICRGESISEPLFSIVE